MWRSEWKQVWVGPAKGDTATKESIGKFGLALAIAGGVVNSALYNMDAGHRAVIFDRFGGVQDIVIGEGTHFLIPWVQKPIIFDCRSRPRNVPVITGSKGESHLWVSAVGSRMGWTSLNIFPEEFYVATEKEIYKHAWRDIMSSVPDPCNKANIVIKRVTQIFLFRSAYRSYVYPILYPITGATALSLKKQCTYHD